MNAEQKESLVPGDTVTFLYGGCFGLPKPLVLVEYLGPKRNDREFRGRVVFSNSWFHTVCEVCSFAYSAFDPVPGMEQQKERQLTQE